MKILIADKLSSIGIDFLKEQDGFDVIEIYDLPKGERQEKLLELVPEVGGIIVRSDSKITREVLEKAPKLRAVGRAGVGVDNIDIEAATDHGVVVMNTPGGNTIATAELTFTHMLCGARPVPPSGNVDESRSLGQKGPGWQRIAWQNPGYLRYGPNWGRGG